MKLLVLITLVLATAGLQAQTNDLERQQSGAALAGAPAGTVLTVLEGYLVTSEGSPAAGAVVVTSAGGRAVAGADGFFRLEVELPLDVERVHVTATHGSGPSSSVYRTTAAVVPGGVNAIGLVALPQRTCEPSWRHTFGAPGLDDVVTSEVVFDDGTGPALYAGGQFRRAGPVAADRIAKWDGDRWSALGSGMNGGVHALTVFDDGGGPALYAGGDFTTAGGVAASRIAKWDGTNWSALTSGLSNAAFTARVLALAVFDDGSGGGPGLYAGGDFTTAGGAPANGIAKWDGTSWSDPGGGVSGSVLVRALAVFDDGRGGGPALYAGGSFTTAGGAPASRIARWNGTTWSALNSGMNEAVEALSVFDDGAGPALYAGGSFTQAGIVAANRIAKWDGTRWSALQSGLSPGIVKALSVFDDGSGPALYAGGSFLQAGSFNVFGIAKWDGTRWSSIGGVSGSVLALSAFDDGSGAALFAGGDFLSAGGGVLANRVARWDGAWSVLDSGPDLELDGSVRAMLVFDDGTGPGLYVGGAFAHAGGLDARGIARWDGTSWSPLGSGVDGSVRALKVFDDGSSTGPALYAGGSFRQAGGGSASDIAKWDGTSWSPLGGGLVGEFPPCCDEGVRALEVFDDGSGAGPALYAGGDITNAGIHAVLTTFGIARWDGSVWSAVGLGLMGPVRALTVFDDGNGPALYAGGDFDHTGGGTVVNHIARWNGSGSWSPLGPGLDGSVHALRVFDDGSGAGPALYAGGWFERTETTNGVTLNHIARWDGASWTPLGSGVAGDVFALSTFDDGSGDGPTLQVAGCFSIAGGVAANCIAKWNGSSWFALGSGMGCWVRALSTFHGGGGKSLYAGGDFPPAPDSGDKLIARWKACPDSTAPIVSCPAEVFAYDRWSSPPGEIVTFTVTARDESDPAPTVACVPPSGSFFPRGTTLVRCTATDADGNRSTCEFEVTVLPKARPR